MQMSRSQQGAKIDFLTSSKQLDIRKLISIEKLVFNVLVIVWNYLNAAQF
jgi:hypothetical protein